MSMGVILSIGRGSNNDENIVAALEHLVFAELEPPVADADAGLELVFIAVPRAGEMYLVGKLLPFVGAVGVEDVHHLVDQNTFARGAAGVDAVVRVGVV